MSERVLRGAPASPGLAAGHARVLSHPSGASAREPVPEAELEAEAARARAALADAAAELERIAARPARQRPRRGGRDRRDRRADGRRSGSRGRGERRSDHAAARRPRGAPRRQRRACRRDRVAARPCPRRASRRCALARPPRRAHRRRIRRQRAARTARRSSSWRRIWALPTWRSTARRWPAIALSGGGDHGPRRHRRALARDTDGGAGGRRAPRSRGRDRARDRRGRGRGHPRPSPERVELADSASRARTHAREKERAESALPAVTSDGRRVRVLVNAATPAEVFAGLSAGAEGAGLIRTELAFLDAGGWPSRSDHVGMLAPLLSSLNGLTATVRVLDFGGDKLPPFLRGEPRRGHGAAAGTPGGPSRAAGGDREVRGRHRAARSASAGARRRRRAPHEGDARRPRASAQPRSDDRAAGGRRGRARDSRRV